MSEWPGTPEQRDARRAWAIGVAVWPAIRKKPDRWLQRLREATNLVDRWMWHPDALQEPAQDRTRAAMFGSLVMGEWANGRGLRAWGRWMKMAAQVDDSRESWLWCKECLAADGWHEVEVQRIQKDGSKDWLPAWTKNADKK